MREIPRLSPSIGHKLTTESALSAWSAHRLLGGVKSKPTDSQRDGRLWHAMLLEDGGGIEVLDFDSFRTKDAREARDKAEHEGKIPIVAAKWDAMKIGAHRILEQLHAAGIQLDGKVEERIEWNEQSTMTGESVPCSGYIDHRNDLRIDDLKTGEVCVTLNMAAGIIAKSHSLLQGAAYPSAIAAIHEVDRERVEMRYIFVQTKEPYCVTPVTLSGEFRELAHLRWQRAIDDWGKYLALGTERKHWPGPCEGIGVVHPPGWMMALELEMEAMRS